jgi:5-methylthioribose kinase
VEIMRRLIGIAQLPLKLNLGQKEVLLERAIEMIMKP